MQTIEVNLAKMLADEFALGCDVFGLEDIWEVIEGYSDEALEHLESDVRKEAEPYLMGGALSEEFLQEQIDLWIYKKRK